MFFQAPVSSNKLDDKRIATNEVSDKTPTPAKTSYNAQTSPRNTECPPSSKPAMANRLLDWFSVIMEDSKHNRQRVKPKGKLEFTKKKAQTQYVKIKRLQTFSIFLLKQNHNTS